MVRKQVNLPGYFVDGRDTRTGMLVYSTGTKLCKAMKIAGIIHPDSQEGINFCVDKCPYDKCEFDQKIYNGKRLITAHKASIVKKMQSEGMTHKEIAVKIKVSLRTVGRWLR